MRRVGRGLHLGSGRVIALGRLLLASLFLAAIWADTTQPAQFPLQAYILLVSYAALAAVLALFAWTNWWLDAQLAGPAHALDILLFTMVVFLTPGDTSPYFIFCIFVLLSAAIRWGWRATALTAVLLTLLYIVAVSLTAGSSPDFELDRFMTRTGYLVILSLILIWFGVNQWRSGLRAPAKELIADSSSGTEPLETALRSAMAETRARRGVFIWSVKSARTATALIAKNGHITTAELDARSVDSTARAPFIYDQASGRALMRDDAGNLRSADANELVGPEAAEALRLRKGLAVPIFSDRGQGQLYLEQVPGMSVDHLEIGQEISNAVTTLIQRGELMKAAEENAEARSRLAIARDRHDSVVQFLAGAAFRLEAMKRSQASGRDLQPELDELKELMLQEQSELRSFITALRSGSQMELADLARDLQALANRLSRQWDVHCTVSAESSEMLIPTRLHFDAQQLVREAVANAVRHAGAKNVSVRVGSKDQQVTLDFINDGATYGKGAARGQLPGSLKERVEAAGGQLDLSRGMGVTRISISLPLAGKAA